MPPTNEQLEQAAISELIAHGGNKADVDLLRRQFKAMSATNQPPMEIPNDGAAQ